MVSSPAHLNAHLPQRLLLASCQLRLAHAHQLQVYRINLETSHSHKTDPSSEVGKRKFHLDAAIVACQHAIQLVTDSALHDPCLDAELNSIYGNHNSTNNHARCHVCIVCVLYVYVQGGIEELRNEFEADCISRE